MNNIRFGKSRFHEKMRKDRRESRREKPHKEEQARGNGQERMSRREKPHKEEQARGNGQERMSRREKPHREEQADGNTGVRKASEESRSNGGDNFNL